MQKIRHHPYKHPFFVTYRLTRLSIPAIAPACRIAYQYYYMFPYHCLIPFTRRDA